MEEGTGGGVFASHLMPPTSRRRSFLLLQGISVVDPATATIALRAASAWLIRRERRAKQWRDTSRWASSLSPPDFSECRSRTALAAAVVTTRIGEGLTVGGEQKGGGDSQIQYIGREREVHT